MNALACRVTRAKLEQNPGCRGGIADGWLVLVTIERGDGSRQAKRLAEQLLALRRKCQPPDPTSTDPNPPAQRLPELLLVRAFSADSEPDALAEGAAAAQVSVDRAAALMDYLLHVCGPGTHLAQDACLPPCVVEAHLDGPMVARLSSNGAAQSTQQTQQPQQTQQAARAIDSCPSLLAMAG